MGRWWGLLVLAFVRCHSAFLTETKFISSKSDLLGGKANLLSLCFLKPAAVPCETGAVQLPALNTPQGKAQSCLLVISFPFADPVLMFSLHEKRWGWKFGLGQARFLLYLFDFKINIPKSNQSEFLLVIYICFNLSTRYDFLKGGYDEEGVSLFPQATDRT